MARGIAVDVRLFLALYILTLAHRVSALRLDLYRRRNLCAPQQSITDRKLRRRQLTEDGSGEISGRDLCQVRRSEVPQTAAVTLRRLPVSERSLLGCRLSNRPSSETYQMHRKMV